MMKATPVTLEGRRVRLEPLDFRHVGDLAIAGADESIWRLLPYGPITTPDRMAAFVRDVLAIQARGTELPFAVVDRATGRAIGSTRYLEIRPEHHGLEIGGTWYGVAHQRTGVNTECKALLLAHAFETLAAIRVQLKTDLRNERSQRAIERIGATHEGILRENILMPDGYRRSTVYYSILDREWPEVKARLVRFASRPLP
jgi:RimJ/RimL family protein N-acetyltransferase